MASVIMAPVTIMASVTYSKCDLWQVLLMANVIMAKVFMAKVIWQMKLSLWYIKLTFQMNKKLITISMILK